MFQLLVTTTTKKMWQKSDFAKKYFFQKASEKNTQFALLSSETMYLDLNMHQSPDLKRHFAGSRLGRFGTPIVTLKL